MYEKLEKRAPPPLSAEFSNNKTEGKNRPKPAANTTNGFWLEYPNTKALLLLNA
jgi:hypothetical protein